MPETLFDVSKLGASDDWKPKSRTDHERMLKGLRQSEWYDSRLRDMSFHLCDIHSDRPLADILQSYAQCLKDNPLQFLDRHILRLELRQLARENNNDLKDLAGEHFPGNYDYEHRRQCPYRNKKYLEQDKALPLKYQNAAAGYILNSIGNHALFQRSSWDLKKELLSHNNLPNDPNILSNVSLYDFLPNQFLIGRIWAIRSLSDQMIDAPSNFQTSIYSFEALMREARYQFRHPQPYSSEIIYINLHTQEYTQYIQDSTESFLFALNNHLSSMAA